MITLVDILACSVFWCWLYIEEWFSWLSIWTQCVRDSNNRNDVVDVTETPTSKLAGKKAIVGLQDVDPINIDIVGTFTQIEKEIHEV